MSKYVAQAGTRQKEDFKCPETSGMMRKEWSARKQEVLKPEGLLTSLEGGVEQPQLFVILAALGSRTDC